MTTKAAGQSPQEKLNAYLQENNLSLVVVFSSPNGSKITLPDAIKPDYLDWAGEILPIPRNGQPEQGDNGDNGNG